MTWDEMLADDMAQVFCATDEFGESLVYTKKTGVTRTIRGRVERSAPETVTGFPSPAIVLKVPNSTTYGFTMAEVDFGGDTVTVARRIGETPQALRIHRLATGQRDHDQGAVYVELR